MTLKPELILLVDDSDDDNYYHQRAIKKSGLSCQVDVCLSGDVAMDYLTNQGEYESRGNDFAVPDLIFLDINMPRVSGWDFLDRYAQWIEAKGSASPAPTSIVIVMLSTSLNPADRDRASESPYIKDYRPKPLKTDAFIEVVTTYFPKAFD